MTETEHGQCQTAHAIRCREQSRQGRSRLDKAKAADEARRAKARAYKDAKVLAAAGTAKEPKTHCEFGGHPWIPANLIVTERVTMSGRAYFTARCRLCGKMPKHRMVKRTAVEGSRSEMMARQQAIKHRILGTDTDGMSRAELAEWRETLAKLRAEFDRLGRACGGVD